MTKESFENGQFGTALEDSKPHPTKPGCHSVSVSLPNRDVHGDLQKAEGAAIWKVTKPVMDRQWKIAGVDWRILIDFFNMRHAWEFLALPNTPEIPEGSIVVSVRENWDRRTLDFLIEHPSFDPVPDGEMVPRIDGLMLTRDVFRRLPLPYERTPIGGTA